jgi:hypothetical protein
MRGGYGEKHDSFIDMDFKTGSITKEFTGQKLFNGETGFIIFI